MTRSYLSVIIPVYNGWEKLTELLGSLNRSKFQDFEVIVGDDASHQEKSRELLELLKKHERMASARGGLANGFGTVQIVRLPVNKGPAAARNAAAKEAQGRVLVFLDADVTCYPDTLKNIAEKFQADPDLTALTGVWDKHQRNHDFFPQFKALRDWSYWINERDSDGYYYLFSTRIAAIKREVFVRLGGFNEAFRQMEDVEITYRIARRYAIIFAPDVRVHHEFEGFWPVAKKYFWRSFYWSKLYQARKKFDPVATTVWETMAGLSGVGVIGLIATGAILYFAAPISWVRVVSLTSATILMLLHIFLLRKFLSFVYQEKGFGFAFKSFLTGLVLYCFIFAGAVYYQLRKNV